MRHDAGGKHDFAIIIGGDITSFVLVRYPFIRSSACRDRVASDIRTVGIL